MAAPGSAQALVERARAREAIRAAVRSRGAWLRDASATGMVAALVAAALAPIVMGAPVAEVVILLGATGGGYISDFLRGVVGRLRGRDGTGGSEAELREELERELLACLERRDGRAAQLRAGVGALLASVQGVRTALEAAPAAVQLALLERFAGAVS